MPRTGSHRSLTTAAAALIAMLAVPAAAQAVTYTVNPGNSPCAANVCGGLAAAAAAAAPGDVFNVTPGTYGSATFDDGGVTIAATAAGVGVDGSLVFTAGSGGVSKLSSFVVSPQTGSSPAISVTGAAGLQISDSIILHANGDGAQFHEGTTNKIVRSTIATGGQTTAAVRVLSADASTSAKALTVESTLVSGGAAGISVNTGVNGLSSTAGPATLNVRHVTAAGSTNGLVLDSSKAVPLLTGGPFGNITADIADSLIQNGTATANFPGLLLAPANVISTTYTRSLDGGFDSAAYFQDPARKKFRLKAGSPAIDAGGVTAGESATDFEGQDRSAAPTDLGADEYVAQPAAPPPTAGPPPPPANGDGTPPAVVITKPKARQKIKLVTTTTKTVTVTRNGKKVQVKRTTTKRTKISFGGTATDPSGIKGVVLTIEKLSTSTTAKAAAATTAKCRWFNATKGIVLKSCAKPVLLLAKTATDGSWTFTPKSTIRFGAGTYRIIVAGVDNSGARGNSASRADAIHRFTLLKK